MDNVVTAVMKNIGNSAYNGDDKVLGIAVLSARPAQDVRVSLHKALQLVRDYPQNWAFVSCESKEGEKQILENIVHAAASRRTFTRSNPPAPSIPTPAPQKPSTVQQLFVQAALENKCQVETISKTSPGFVRIVMGNGYVGAQTYAVKIPLLPNEFGANMKKHIRYVLDVTEVPTGKPAENTKGTTTFVAPRISRDLEPEALGAVAASGRDDDDDDKD